VQLPPIVVISLARAPARRSAIAAQLEKLGLPFEFFDAIDGAKLSPERVDEVYSPNRTFMRMGRYLHPNEIGCALSHMDIWEHMVRENVPEMLILEDDVVLADDLPTLLATRDRWVPSDARVVYLAHDMAPPVSPTPLDSAFGTDRALCTFENPVMRAAAYLIRTPAAAALLPHGKPLTMPLDDLLGRPEFTGGGIYGIVPNAVMWNDDHPSTIWTDTKPDDFAKQSRAGLGGMVRRFIRRFVKSESLGS
jgi:glycosyl transferase, family 25